MFYCIVCSKLHKQKLVDSRVFKNGFYIDPFRGQKFPLGICEVNKNLEWYWDDFKIS
ncbi:DUF3973 domain-containing protein [Neobacillus novalis]|uniref:DUF3973 domain-containing protein n=1 Tax=Neobacillus novalis TaxID=220687 RepID=A0AA95MJZ8_9BACI|nr:DUF3973 domain-containing protein [Neobacillus novalis]WHY84542.1 DUF3973 domain-containing protein [Neobacillus novalis]